MSAIHRSSAWAKFTRKARPIIARTLPAPCVECGRPINPGERFHIAHIVAHAIDPTQPINLAHVGPGHPHCNITAGAKLGRQRQLARQRQDNRLPKEGSAW